MVVDNGSAENNEESEPSPEAAYENTRAQPLSTVKKKFFTLQTKMT